MFLSLGAVLSRAPEEPTCPAWESRLVGIFIPDHSSPPSLFGTVPVSSLFVSGPRGKCSFEEKDPYGSLSHVRLPREVEVFMGLYG